MYNSKLGLGFSGMAGGALCDLNVSKSWSSPPHSRH